jgi:hypothetical protein
MKSLNALVISSLLAIGVTGSALAVTANSVSYIHIVGAPAYRQNSNDAIAAVVATYKNAGLTATSATSITYGVGGTIESAKQNQWRIPNYRTGVDLIINASYTGSTAGFESVASAGPGGVPQKFIADGTGTVASPLASQSAGSSITPDNTWITLSDTFQGTTIFNGPLTLYGGSGNTSPFTHNYQTLNATQLGVEPYRWVASPGAAAAGLTNITTAQAQLLYENGALPLAFFTGKNSDEGTLVYPLSRDSGSGSRLVALTETGVELPGSPQLITTYQPAVTGGQIDGENSYVGGTISLTKGSIPLYPAGVIKSTGVYDGSAGDTGYPSFGTTDNTGLLQAITATPPANTLFVTYLNIDDSTEASTTDSTKKLYGTAEVLSYNGVTYSPAAVAEGNYFLLDSPGHPVPQQRRSAVEQSQRLTLGGWRPGNPELLIEFGNFTALLHPRVGIPEETSAAEAPRWFFVLRNRRSQGADWPASARYDIPRSARPKAARTC